MSSFNDLTEKSVAKTLQISMTQSNEVIEKTDIKKLEKLTAKLDKYGIKNKKSKELNEKTDSYYKVCEEIKNQEFLNTITKFMFPCVIVKYKDIIPFCSKNGLYITALGNYNNVICTDTITKLETWECNIRDWFSKMHNSKVLRFMVGNNKKGAFFKGGYTNVITSEWQLSTQIFIATTTRNIDPEFLKKEKTTVVGMELFSHNNTNSIQKNSLRNANNDKLVIFSTFLFQNEIYCCIIDGYDESPEDDIEGLLLPSSGRK